MGTQYEIRLSRDSGERLAVLGAGQWQSFSATRVANGVGALDLVVPLGVLDLGLLRRDFLITLLRSVDGGVPRLLHDQAYLIQRLTFDDAAETVTIGAVDLNDLLRRRIVAYYAGSAEARKEQEADDLCKAIVRENIASGAGDYSGAADRGLPADGLVVAADLGQAPVIAKGFAWRASILDLLGDIANASAEVGTYLAFDIVARPNQPPEFQTFIDQRGLDRRFTMIPLSKETGTLAGAQLGYDWSAEVNAAYAGGQGDEELRVVQDASDAARVGASAYARTEAFVFSQATTDAEATDDATAAVRAGRPRVVFSGQFTNTLGVQYDRDLGFGDYVRASAFGRTYDCRLDRVTVGVDSAGLETIDVGLRAEGDV